ncbi:MAG: LacI family DNA-binding transcriptional regulator, partial [Methanobrevibacter sp.]|nr:LacI family DNA-binding transcriptional regulator [Methanobrevibacter sp.]
MYEILKDPLLMGRNHGILMQKKSDRRAKNCAVCVIAYICSPCRRWLMASSATIYDVSRLSGVSTATVSRTFSDPDRVKEATRRKVYDAAAVLNYSPNAIARAM